MPCACTWSDSRGEKPQKSSRPRSGTTPGSWAPRYWPAKSRRPERSPAGRGVRRPYNGPMTQPPPEGTRRRVLIMGAAGRDFHNFNTVFRDDPAVQVVAFTATQIPYIAGRRYPASLAGPLYPKGIPIVEESELVDLARREQVEEVVFAYSDE